MSWASIYWDLEHIVQSAREAMESAYAAELAARDKPSPAAGPPSGASVIENLGAQLPVVPGIANVDPIKTAEAALAIGQKPTSDPAKLPAFEMPAESLEVSVVKSSLAAKTPLPVNQPATQPRSLWTAEFEAALREFLRPLSVNLRYEYRYPDTLDEKRTIAAMNSLFLRQTKPDESDIRNVTAQLELRRKRDLDLRKTAAQSANAKRPPRGAS